MRHTLRLIFITLSFSLLFSYSVSASEFDALMTFFDAAEGFGWFQNTNWGTEANPCNFFGIGCDDQGDIQFHRQNLPFKIWIDVMLTGVTGSVTSIDLNYNNLRCEEIPDMWSALPNLNYLDLSGNSFDTLPNTLYMASRLNYLNIELSWAGDSVRNCNHHQFPIRIFYALKKDIYDWDINYNRCFLDRIRNLNWVLQLNETNFVFWKISPIIIQMDLLQIGE